MAWYYRVLFLSAAGLQIWWGFIRKEAYYPFTKARRETRIPIWLARTVTGLAIFFLWLAFLK
jgi:hypothetical protein